MSISTVTSHLLLLACLLAAVTGMRGHFDDDMMKMKLLRSYFNCPVCDLAACPEPVGCVEVTKEPGICGCCYMCALGEGEPCGMYTMKCGDGLTCRPASGKKGLQSLLAGEALCTKDTGKLSYFYNYD